MPSRLNFSLTQLEYVLALHQWGHFAKAAKACAVTQPTLSMQIKRLEEELGVVLFDRSRKPLLLTAAGQRLIAQIQTVVHEAKRIPALIDALATHEVRGALTVGVIPTVAPYLLPRLLPVVTEKYPALQLTIRELQTQRILDALGHDDLDVGLLATPLEDSQVFERPLYYEPFYLLCHEQHALSRQKRISHHPLPTDDVWLLEEGHCLRSQVLEVCSLRKKSPARRLFEFESGSLETLKGLVDAYGGYTLLPSLATGHIGKHSVLIPFARPAPAREIGLVYRREHYKRELLDALGDAVIAAVPEELRTHRAKELEVLPV